MSFTTEHLDPAHLDHVVQFYERAEDLVGGAAHHLARALDAGDAVVIVATPEHVDGFVDALAAAGADLDAATDAGRFVVRDAAATLEGFVDGGRIDPDRFDATVGALVHDAAAGGRPVRVFGEMVQLLWSSGERNAAVELEELWNELARREAFSLYCAYDVAPDGADHRVSVDQICHLHDTISAARTFDGLAAPRAARAFVRELLAGRVDPDVSDDATLAVSELTTNAVLHAASSFSVTVTLRPGSVRVAVRDESPALPAWRAAHGFETSGRGLHIVAGVAQRWGIDIVASGKVVWAELGR